MTKEALLCTVVGIDKICFFFYLFCFSFLLNIFTHFAFQPTHFAFQPTHFACLSPIFLIYHGTQLSQPSLEITVCRPNVKFVLF